jgi:SAM-dependent methyltransferase
MSGEKPLAPSSPEPLEKSELAAITARTLQHYESSASDFWAGTKDHDVSENYAALLSAIEGTPPFSILDLGCGPGRDLHYFKSLGHAPIGLDGSASFVEMARAHAGVEVWHQDFLALSLPASRFDGIFANASLFHVPTQELPRVLAALRGSLRPRGVLFASNPHGDGQEGWSKARYGAYHSLETWRQFMVEARFEEVRHFYRPTGKPRSEQPWLASVWRAV